MLYVHMGFIKKISLGPQKISKTKFGHSRQFFFGNGNTKVYPRM